MSGVMMWNKYQITIVGQHYTVVLNGEKGNEFDGARGVEGYMVCKTTI